MNHQTSLEYQLLDAAYTAFNTRNSVAALALMTPDVAWPRAFKGGFVVGQDEVRAYWKEQWSEIDPTVQPVNFITEDSTHVIVEVHQVVRDLNGSIIADDHVRHRFTFDNGLIQKMEILA